MCSYSCVVAFRSQMDPSAHPRAYRLVQQHPLCKSLNEHVS